MQALISTIRNFFLGLVLLTHPSPIPSPTPIIISSPPLSAENSASPKLLPSPDLKAKPKQSPSPVSTIAPNTPAQTITLHSSAKLDGFRLSDGGGDNTKYIQVARSYSAITRGFVSFSVPDEIKKRTVDTATLRLFQEEVQGDAYGTGGPLLVEHVDYAKSGGIESSDYNQAPIDAYTGTLQPATGERGWKAADVTDAVRADLATSQNRSEFRLRFKTETTGADVSAIFSSMNPAITERRPMDGYRTVVVSGPYNNNPPELVIRYH